MPHHRMVVITHFAVMTARTRHLDQTPIYHQRAVVDDLQFFGWRSCRIRTFFCFWYMAPAARVPLSIYLSL